MLKNALIISLSFILCSVSLASNEDDQPRFKTWRGVMYVEREFQQIQEGLGVLENLKQLNGVNRNELEPMKKRLENIKKEYKSEAFDRMWNSTLSHYELGKQAAIRIDRDVELNIKRGKDSAEFNGKPYDSTFDDVYICTHTLGGRKFSKYVDLINSARGSLSLPQYRLEKLLPATPNSGVLMMTNTDIYRGAAPMIYCKPHDGTVNPSIALDKASIEAEIAKAALVESNRKARIEPYSVSQTPQHESICFRVPKGEEGSFPLFGAKCVYNYK